MGFTDLLQDTGLQMLNSWLETRSYIVGYTPTQADVATFKGLKEAPAAAKYPHAARWYKHIATYQPEFTSLQGDPAKAYTTYGPDASEIPTHPKDMPNAAAEEEEEDLFGSESEEEDPEVVAKREANLAAYKAKKEAKGPKPAAKSIVTLDVKPWDDETDMAQLEKNLRAIEQDGLVWGGSKLVPVGFGIKKLQITLVVEDEKVSLDELQDRLAEDEDHVQSSDIAAMQKL